MRIYLLFLSFVPLVILGQDTSQKIISLDSIITNFYNSSKQIVSDNYLNHYDTFIGYELGDGILTESPLIYLPDNDSIRSCHAEWEIDYSDIAHPFLCLKKIIPLGISKGQATKFKEDLANLYGKRSDTIHAIWFTGNLIFYSCPKNLFGEFVSGGKTIFTVRSGEIMSRKYIVSKAGTIAEYFKLKPQQIKGTNISFSVSGYNDGCWTNGSNLSARALTLFVNDSLKLSNHSGFQRKFMFLLYTDSVGISTLHLLQPIMPDAVEQKLITGLKNQIAKLSRWSFGWLETINGDLFPGCYLEAEYSSECGWAFKDYVYKNNE